MEKKLETGLSEVRGEVAEVRVEINGIKGEIKGLRGEVSELREVLYEHVDYVDKQFMNIRNTMVTKADLEDRLADEGARYGSLIRETNVILGGLTDALASQGSLSRAAATRIKAKRPFFKKVRAS